MPKYMSQASKMDRYKASKDYLKIKTQQSRLPSIDKARYHQRKGLEGPFMTKSGQVIYYDKKFGKYYNSDTDMYIDHDDWKKMSEAKSIGLGPYQSGKAIATKMMKYPSMKAFAPKVAKIKIVTRADLEKILPDYVGGKVITTILGEEAPANATGTAVAGTGDDSSTVVVKKKKKLQDKLMRRLKIKEAIDRAVPDLEYPKDEITERKQQLIDLAKKYGENI